MLPINIVSLPIITLIQLVFKETHGLKGNTCPNHAKVKTYTDNCAINNKLKTKQIIHESKMNKT